MITVELDKLTDCVENTETGEKFETVFARAHTGGELQECSEVLGWFIEWELLLDKYEIYKLLVKETHELLGLVAILNIEDKAIDAVYVAWMVANPYLRKVTDVDGKVIQEPKYLGIGGNLFAIAAQKSVQYGHQGYMYGFAANKKLEEHYIMTFGGKHLGILHPYHFEIREKEALNDVLRRYCDGSIEESI